MVAITYQFAILNAAPGYAKGNFWSFFTIQSNVLAVGLLCLLSSSSPTGERRSFDAVRRRSRSLHRDHGRRVRAPPLGPTRSGPDGLPWVDFVVHKLMPILVVADWLVEPPRHRLPRWTAAAWLVYPLAWFVYTLARGAIADWYPYPFVDVSELGTRPCSRERSRSGSDSGSRTRLCSGSGTGALGGRARREQARAEAGTLRRPWSTVRNASSSSPRLPTSGCRASTASSGRSFGRRRPSATTRRTTTPPISASLAGSEPAAPARGGWTAKLPAERVAPFLVRPEIVFDGNSEEPPEAAVDLVTGFVRGEELAKRVQMTTIRRRTGLHDSGGRLLAGVVDDAVSVLNGESPWTFREIEVEIGEEMTTGLLDALVERLRQAGAGGPDQTAKYVRALAPSVPLVPEIVVADLGADATAGDVVRRAIALSVIRLILHDPVVRLDADTEGVHQARVATRRLRSDLRTFRPLLDREWSQALREELGWIARILGEVRDGDVLRERLTATHRRATGHRARVGRAPCSPRCASPCRGRTRISWRRSAPGRYVDLLDRLVDAANTPASGGGGVPAGGGGRPRPRASAVAQAREAGGELGHAARRRAARGSDPDEARPLRRRGVRARRGKPARTRPRRPSAPRRARRPHDAIVAAEGGRLGRTPELGRGAARRRGPRGGRARVPPKSSARAAGRLGRAGGAGLPRLDVTETVRAAGGLVDRVRDEWDRRDPRRAPARLRRLVVPEGKLEADETEEAAALPRGPRGDGLRCGLGRELPATRYRDARGRPSPCATGR